MDRAPNRSKNGSDELPSPLPLVGRLEELSDLLRLLRSGDGGHPPLAVLTGEAGVGKSRLLDALGAEAASRGWKVARGRAFPMEAGVPYSVFSDAFLPLLRDLDADRLTVLSRGGEGELGYLFPALLGGARPRSSPTSNPEELRSRIFWTFAELLKNWSRREPLLVALEDLHWADESSLQLLHFLARQTGSARIGFLCTYTITERGRNPSLMRVERSLLAMGRARLHELGPLDPDEVLELVRRTFEADERVVQEFSTLLFEWTRGNPFFVEEVLKALVEAGRLHRRDGTWLGWEIRRPELPASVRDAVVSRLERLGGPARRVADLVAVTGARTSYRLLHEVSELPHAVLLETLETLCEHRVLREQTADEAVVYDFVHPLVREILHSEFGLARLRLLHGTIAEALEELYGPRSMEHADELAYHFARTDAGHLAGKAARYLAAAGRAALARRADREAVNYLASALEQMERQRAARPEPSLHRPTLLTELARAHHHLGEYDEAIRRWSEARTLLQGDPERRAEVERYLGLAHFWNGDPGQAMTNLDRALESATGGGALRAAARIRLSRGMCLQETGRPEVALEEIRRALDTAARLEDPGLLARVHRSLALAHVWTGPPAAVFEHAARGLELAAETDDDQVRFWCRWAIAVNQGLSGQTAEMARELEEARGLAEGLRSPVLRLWTAEMTIEHHYATGRWDSGIALGERSIAMARTLNQHMLLPRLLVWVAAMYLERGDRDRGGTLVDEACRLAGLGGGEPGRSRSVHALVPAHIGRAHFHLYGCEYEQAVEVGERGLGIAEGTGYVLWSLHRLMPVVAEAYLWLEDMEGARRICTRMRQHAERLHHPLGHAWADACDAMIRWKEGDAREGAARMREAARALEAIPMIPAAARVRRQLAGRLEEIGDVEGSLRELRKVHDTFSRLGAERELEKARDQFRDLGRRPPPRFSTNGIGGLTDRELEVAVLVATGMSNKAVARDLGISPRTVTTHLTNIYQKLDLSSRLQLADLIRQGDLDGR